MSDFWRGFRRGFVGSTLNGYMWRMLLGYAALVGSLVYILSRPR